MHRETDIEPGVYAAAVRMRDYQQHLSKIEPSRNPSYPPKLLGRERIDTNAPSVVHYHQLFTWAAYKGGKYYFRLSISVPWLEVYRCAQPLKSRISFVEKEDVKCILYSGSAIFPRSRRRLTFSAAHTTNIRFVSSYANRKLFPILS